MPARPRFLTHPVFNSYHSEHEMLRYLHRLQARDLSLAHSMIPLGSCTMKLNATAEMLPVTWPEFGAAASLRARRPGRRVPSMFDDLEAWLAEITGLAAVSLQPNSGAQGEYAGLLTIRAYHQSRGDSGRTVVPDPGLRPRDQPGQRGHGRHRGGPGGLRRAGQHRRRGPAREG